MPLKTKINNKNVSLTMRYLGSGDDLAKQIELINHPLSFAINNQSSTSTAESITPSQN